MDKLDKLKEAVSLLMQFDETEDWYYLSLAIDCLDEVINVNTNSTQL